MRESSTRYYSDSEIELLIDEITVAAIEAIEQAAGEAARAAFLESLEREAAALREVQMWRMEAETTRRAGIRNMIISGIVGLTSGLIVGLVVSK